MIYIDFKNLIICILICTHGGTLSKILNREIRVLCVILIQYIQRQNNSSAPRRNKEVPKFMEGIRGVHAFQEQPKAHQLQKKIQVMCEWRGKKGFPGCQPVSMDRTNITFLRQKPYRLDFLCRLLRITTLVIYFKNKIAVLCWL